MNNIKTLKLTEGFGGEYLTKEIIKRSKDNKIIYLTEDVLLNTKCVQELAQYLENLIQENKELKEKINVLNQEKEYLNTIIDSDNDNYIPKSKLKEKIEELKGRKMDIVASPVYNTDEKLKILEKDKIRKAILQELLGENQ